MITRLLSTALPPRRYGVIRVVCIVELSFSGGGTRVPFRLAGDVVAYLSSPGEHLSTLTSGVFSPFPHSVTALATWYMSALIY